MNRKRIFDTIVIGILSPLWVTALFVVAICVRFSLGTPVLFAQSRPGLDGRPFRMYKFRSMSDLRDESGNLLSDQLRITKFGRLLRSSSLDELPGLWCVLKGDMSLVGPRPLLMEYLPIYSAEEARRHEVRPGITGWAQINGRNTISWKDKFKLDVWYVDNQNFWLDLKILFLTFKKVLMREDISAKGESTMTKFTGN